MNPTINLSKNPTWIIIYAGRSELEQYSMGLVCPQCSAKVAKSFINLKEQGYHPFVSIMVDPNTRRESRCAYCGKDREMDPVFQALRDEVLSLEDQMREAREAGDKAKYSDLLDKAVIAEKARNDYAFGGSDGLHEQEINVTF